MEIFFVPNPCVLRAGKKRFAVVRVVDETPSFQEKH